MNDEVVLEEIVAFCRKNVDIIDAKRYLAERNISKESIETFEIGFLPKDMRELFKKVDPIKLREIGFIKDASYSWFTNRIVFPIRNQYSKLVAVAGRVLPQFSKGNKYKYFNTLYEKGKVLYGLDLAIPEIRKTSEVLVTEGYLDITTAFQYGIKNIVATCGTAFTFEHAMLLSRYTDNVKFLYDADLAGKKATQKVLEKDWEFKELKISHALLYKDEDVDSFLKKYGREKFLDIVYKNDMDKIKTKLLC